MDRTQHNSKPVTSSESSTRAALADSEEIFKLLVDAVEDYAIFALDANGVIMTWNRGGERLKGYSADEVIGTHFSRFYLQPEIDRQHPQFELEQAKAVGKYEEEGWRVRKDGTVFWANVVITALRDSHGRLRGFGKVTRDLTQRRLADQKLKESEERFRLLVESVEDYAVFMLSPEGKITTWNRGAEKNIGYTSEEAIGQHFSMFFPEEDLRLGKAEHELEEAKSVGRFETECWRVRKDGSQFWASIVLSPIYDAEKKLLGFSKVTRNLTERKRAEDELRQAYQNLECRIETRTRELSEAKQRAEAAVQARDEFFSIASHELKTPLTSLLLQTQIRQKCVERGDYSDFERENIPKLLEDDNRQISRLGALVDNMLDISRLTSGSFSLNRENFEMGEMLKDVVQRMTPALKITGNDLSLKASEPVSGNWDRLRLEQVFGNLLSNAGKYAPGKPVQIEFKTEGSSVQIFVRDQGDGISPEDQKRIFYPFQRAKIRSEVSGLGLGLHISKQIVEAHSGRLWVESAVGVGTTFIVELPLNEPSRLRSEP
jgi:PAS domain S-box-containing protein